MPRNLRKIFRESHGCPILKAKHKDPETLKKWLTNINYEEYFNLFADAGYDMPTISRMTPEDLTAIGITKPSHRRKLKTEIQKLNIGDGIPSYKPETLQEWFKLLRLEDYLSMIKEQGYDSISRVSELAWEDLEEIGIVKLGHQKRLMLAIKRLQDLNNGVKRYSAMYNDAAHMPSSSSLSSTSSGSCPDVTRPLNASFNPPVNNTSIFQSQEVLIKTANTKSTLESPTTPELKTFQQIPNIESSGKGPHIKDHSPNSGFVQSSPYKFSPGSNRGRSFENLSQEEVTYLSKTQLYGHYGVVKKQLISDSWRNGYLTDDEVRVLDEKSQHFSYDIDGTMTLRRPKGLLIKPKPIAKIAAKSRQIETVSYSEPLYDYKQNISNINSPTEDKSTKLIQQAHSVSLDSCQKSVTGTNMNYAQEYDTVPTSTMIYATLKRKKIPPMPPKRTNSMKTDTASRNYVRFDANESNQIPNGNQCIDLESMQEQAFATCVKSLTSRFSMVSATDEKPPVPIRQHSMIANDNLGEDFPPPPSNACLSNEAFQDVRVPITDSNTQRTNTQKESVISSSSSTESMPFANDNVGTIKPKNIIHMASKYSSSTGNSPTSPPSQTSPISGNSFSGSLLHSLPSSPIKAKSTSLVQCTSSTSIKTASNNESSGDVIDDIELMLENLSNQLDAILENEINCD